MKEKIQGGSLKVTSLSSAGRIKETGVRRDSADMGRVPREQSPGGAPVIGTSRKLDIAWNNFIEHLKDTRTTHAEEAHIASVRGLMGKLNSFLFQKGGVFTDSKAAPEKRSEKRDSGFYQSNSAVFQGKKATGSAHPQSTETLTPLTIRTDPSRTFTAGIPRNEPVRAAAAGTPRNEQAMTPAPLTPRNEAAKTPAGVTARYEAAKTPVTGTIQRLPELSRMPSPSRSEPSYMMQSDLFKNEPQARTTTQAGHIDLNFPRAQTGQELLPTMTQPLPLSEKAVMNIRIPLYDSTERSSFNIKTGTTMPQPNPMERQVIFGERETSPPFTTLNERVSTVPGKQPVQIINLDSSQDQILSTFTINRPYGLNSKQETLKLSTSEAPRELTLSPAPKPVSIESQIKLTRLEPLKSELLKPEASAPATLRETMTRQQPSLNVELQNDSLPQHLTMKSLDGNALPQALTTLRVEASRNTLSQSQPALKVESQKENILTGMEKAEFNEELNVQMSRDKGRMDLVEQKPGSEIIRQDLLQEGAQNESDSQIEKNLRMMEKLGQHQKPPVIPSPIAPEAAFCFVPIAQSSIWEALMQVWKSYLSATHQDNPLLEYYSSGRYQGSIYNQEAPPDKNQMAYSQGVSSSSNVQEKPGGLPGPALTGLEEQDELKQEQVAYSQEALRRSEKQALSKTMSELQERQKAAAKAEEDKYRIQEENREKEREREKEQEREEEEEEKEEEREKKESETAHAEGDGGAPVSGGIYHRFSPAESGAKENGPSSLLGYPSNADSTEGYYPCWEFLLPGYRKRAPRSVKVPTGISGLSRGRTNFTAELSRKGIFEDETQAGKAFGFPLFTQLYAESSSPFESHQPPPPHQWITSPLLREHMVYLFESGGLFTLHMTLRASRFVASIIEDIIKRKHSLRDIKKDYFAAYVAMLLRISGEFTLSHSLRVMDLALDLARNSNIHDHETLEQIRLGALFKDIGELDFLLSRLPTNKRESIANFLAGSDMKWAGVLHDVGKIKIPKEILYKSGALTDEEFKIMKMHPIYSENILYPVVPLRFLCPVVRAHHERWDGRGYPDGIAGESIPMAARIIAIADVFDALISDRPYKKGMPWEKVREILIEGRGTHFDPILIDAFLESISPLYEKRAR